MASGTLIVPEWFSVPFWPMLFPDGLHPYPFVAAVLVLPGTPDLVCSSRSGNNLFKGVPNTNLLALRLECE